MGILRRRKQRNKSLFDYRKWMDYGRVKNGADTITEAISEFKIEHKRAQNQSLEQAMQRYGLSEADIAQKKTSFLHIFIIMSCVLAILLIYSIYLAFSHAYLGALVGASVSLVTAALCFRYHFWYFQLKHRKLGCSFMEWLKIGVIGTKQ